jgi:raffinose/stachyose/melibiose transport system substrate-binding protein
MKKSLLWVVVLLLSISMIAAFSFVGCKAKAAPAEEEVAAPAEEEAAAPAEEEAAAEEYPATEVTMWSWKTTPDWDDILVPELKDLYNITLNHVEVQLQDYYPKLKSAATAGELPDVIGLECPQSLNMFKDYLEPLDPYYARDFGDNWKDLYIEGLLNQSLVVTGGNELLGALFGLSMAMQLYNGNIFDDLNLSVPKNLDEFKQVADALRDAGYIPFGMGGADAWQLTDMFEEIVGDIDPDLFKEAEAGNVKFTDPKFVQAMDIFKQMVDDKIFQESVFGDNMYMTVWDLFLNDQVAIAKNGSWAISDTKDYVKIMSDGMDYNGDGNAGPFLASPDVAWAISKDSQNKDAAWLVIRHMIHEGFESETTVVSHTCLAAGVPETSSARVKEAWALMQSFFNDGRVIRRNPLYLELQSAIGVAMQAVGTGTKTPDEALAELQTTYDAIEK